MTWWLTVAMAKTWCASPLEVHEWGVEVVRVDGRPHEKLPLPTWFHTQAPHWGPVAAVDPTRHEAPDSGIRWLPVLQAFGEVEGLLGVEVGFTDGAATAWYPQVDLLVSAEEANGPRARAQRDELVRRRTARNPTFEKNLEPLPPDPTRQLVWERLQMRQLLGRPVAPATVPWVDGLRDVPGALWLEGTDEVERFVFYEADTRPVPALLVRAGDQGTEDAPHVVLQNVSNHDVHDVVFLAAGRVWTAPRIPAGASAGFLLEEPFAPDLVQALLHERWLDRDPRPERWLWSSPGDACPMGEDPAIPVEMATGHRIYEAELQVLWSVWADRLLIDDEPRLIYREDPAALDARMPLSIHSDMTMHVDLQRLGVVVMEGWTLP